MTNHVINTKHGYVARSHTPAHFRSWTRIPSPRWYRADTVPLARGHSRPTPMLCCPTPRPTLPATVWIPETSLPRLLDGWLTAAELAASSNRELFEQRVHRPGGPQQCWGADRVGTRSVRVRSSIRRAGWCQRPVFNRPANQPAHSANTADFRGRCVLDPGDNRRLPTTPTRHIPS